MKRSKADLSRLAAEVRKVDLKATPYQRVCPYGHAGEAAAARRELRDSSRGTAENPPKNDQDICPLNFDNIPAGSAWITPSRILRSLSLT
jgi:hypothetical protein